MHTTTLIPRTEANKWPLIVWFPAADHARRLPITFRSMALPCATGTCMQVCRSLSQGCQHAVCRCCLSCLGAGAPKSVAGTVAATSCQLAKRHPLAVLQSCHRFCCQLHRAWHAFCLMLKSIEQSTSAITFTWSGVSAARLIQALAEEGVVRDDTDGVVRISLLHYNTPREVAYLISKLNTMQ